ncbi:MAG: hypothetical protein WD690_01225 [Vicinamibacterales bacterium]
MDERGSALAEALIVTAIVGAIWAAAAGVLAEVPAQAAKWEDAAAMRQRIRVIDARLRRIASSAVPIALEVDGRSVIVPSVWPRRLGYLRPGGSGEVSATAVTFLSRVQAHRALTLAGTLTSAGDVMAVPQPGCGSEIACGLAEGDTVLAVAQDGACGLYRVEEPGVRLRLAALMQPGASSFGPGSVLTRVAIDAISFDPGEGGIRRYDGYRSDNVMVDGVRAFAIDWTERAAGLADGPFIGTGPMAYDTDQAAVRAITMTVDLIEAPPAIAARRTVLRWGMPRWP